MEGVNLSMIYLIYCKNLCEHHDVPLSSTTIKKIIKAVTVRSECRGWHELS
jgi:hypothetical protein